MSANKPVRKPKSGGKKESQESALAGRERKRAAKRKGLKAGSRHSGTQSGGKSGKKDQKDPRIGSRKPVALVVEAAKPQAPKAAPVKEEKPLMLAPEQELAAIENDDRLNELLDRLDEGEALSPADQAWVEQMVARHQQLMEELGPVEEDEEDEAEEPATDDELWDRFLDADFKPESKP
ncbi:GTPase-activating protein [Aeromonas schubertii]|uniref:Der GTPase-activating protein YihI n=1 Tax=Aeromonas schubertii TaxID=652 RepID=A0ABS7VC13_9GAMM|nr:Der GTPase-activating protein YihI [Aeromonas schubertii]MBZ6066577.1 GTPase-activating protein [Aeromonas schubertii]